MVQLLLQMVCICLVGGDDLKHHPPPPLLTMNSVGVNAEPLCSTRMAPAWFGSATSVFGQHGEHENMEHLAEHADQKFFQNHAGTAMQRMAH